MKRQQQRGSAAVVINGRNDLLIVIKNKPAVRYSTVMEAPLVLLPVPMESPGMFFDTLRSENRSSIHFV